MGQLGPVRQPPDLGEADAVGGRADLAQEPDPLGTGPLRQQQVLQCHGAAQVGDAGVVAHGPKPFPRAGDGFGGRAGDGPVPHLREQGLLPVGVAEAGVHPHEFAHCAVRQRLRAGFGGILPGPPGHLPAVYRQREAPVAIVRQAEVGQKRGLPAGAWMGGEEPLQRGVVVNAPPVLVAAQGFQPVGILLRRGGGSGDQRLLEQRGPKPGQSVGRLLGEGGPGQQEGKAKKGTPAKTTGDGDGGFDFSHVRSESMLSRGGFAEALGTVFISGFQQIRGLI